MSMVSGVMNSVPEKRYMERALELAKYAASLGKFL